jgi:PIN domain nuclease of toxin-antitoxin system
MGAASVYLLDTHALVWGVTAPEQLPAPVREILEAGEIKVSVVSYWELMLKKERQNALVVHPAAWWQRYVTRASVEVLPVHVAHVDRLGELGEWHRDPFDRMLVAQALAEELTLVTKDAVLARYSVPVIWE